MLSLETIANLLRLSPEVISIAESLIDRLDRGQKEIQGIWGAALLLSWEIVKKRNNLRNAARLYKIDVARAAQVSESTISSRMRDLENVLTEEERQWLR